MKKLYKVTTRYLECDQFDTYNVFADDGRTAMAFVNTLIETGLRKRQKQKEFADQVELIASQTYYHA